MNDCHNPVYAMCNGTITHISDVSCQPRADYTCPSCGEHLIPKQTRREAFFAHESGEPCRNGFVHSLCCAAAETIARRGEFTLPAVSIDFNSTKKPIILSQPRAVSFDNVGLIWADGEDIPEILLEKDNKKLLLVIFAEEPFDLDKLVKIINSDLSSIALDLRDVDGSTSKAAVEDMILGAPDRKIWLYNALADHYLDLFLKVSDKYRIVRHGNMLYAEYCPLAVRTRNGFPCANYIDDCSGGCEYFICHSSAGKTRFWPRDNFTGEYIFCSGKKRISTLSHLVNYLPDAEHDRAGDRC